MSKGLTDFLTCEHRHCDELLAEAEIAASKNEWQHAETSFREFYEATTRHLSMEEEVLFPAFEKKTGNTRGPTCVMRSEHREIRNILDDLNEALSKQNCTSFLGFADTLNIMLQQHNMKEENILYPMTEQVLFDMQNEIMEAMCRLGVVA